MAALTQSPTMGDVLKYEAEPNYSRESVTLLSGTSYGVGSVLGKITASGKYQLAADGAVDGSAVAVAVLLTATDATAGDATGVILARGPAIVSKAALVFDATVNDAPKTATKHTELAAALIVPRTSA
jgi:hypothetical protein